MDSIRGELIDIVEWLDETRDTIVWRFPRHDNEIKNNARLVVREGQTALFVNEGQLADVYGPGTHILTTANMPILSTLKGWKFGFDSPFKAEVYFVSGRLFTDAKWGTQNPIMMRDPEFGMVRVRAFGAYSCRVVDPVACLRELVGTDPSFRTEEISEYIRQQVVARMATALATSGFSVLDMAAHQNKIGDGLAETLTADLASMGLAIPRVIIENVSLPAEVEAVMDKRTSMGVLGNLDNYTKLQAASSIEIAAGNEGGGLAAAGVGMGLGAVMAGQLAGSLTPPAAAAAPPALPAPPAWFLGTGGVQSGPHSTTEVLAMRAAGTVAAGALAWRDGMAAWTPLADVAELRPAGPPPLPS